MKYEEINKKNKELLLKKQGINDQIIDTGYLKVKSGFIEFNIINLVESSGPNRLKIQVYDKAIGMELEEIQELKEFLNEWF